MEENERGAVRDYRCGSDNTPRETVNLYIACVLFVYTHLIQFSVVNGIIRKKTPGFTGKKYQFFRGKKTNFFSGNKEYFFREKGKFLQRKKNIFSRKTEYFFPGKRLRTKEFFVWKTVNEIYIYFLVKKEKNSGKKKFFKEKSLFFMNKDILFQAKALFLERRSFFQQRSRADRS